MFPSPPTPPPSLLTSRRVQTVSELTSSITLLMESEFPFVAICGEISNIRRPYSGHLYFTLKDSQAQIRCVLFKNQQRFLSKTLTDGTKVICKGRLSVYKQRGEYQLILDHVSEDGTGNLHQNFEELKEKLLSEGLFSPEAKKKLPTLARKIYLITSPTGAAVHDFLKKALERFSDLEVKILPTAVQGENAAREIIKQITVANKENQADVIVLTRGGGSLEDFAAFNDEQLARAIYASRLPIVSAIGHEVDFTIADFVADHRSPTPTAAAEEVIFDQKQIKLSLTLQGQRMAKALSNCLQRNQKRLAATERLLTDPRKIIDHYQLKVDHITLNLIHRFTKKNDLARKQFALCRQKLTALSPDKQITTAKNRNNTLINQLIQHIKDKLHEGQEELARQSTLLDALSPLAVLGRGYALAMTEDKKIIHSIKQIKEGDPIDVRVNDGIISGIIKKTTRN